MRYAIVAAAVKSIMVSPKHAESRDHFISPNSATAPPDTAKLVFTVAKYA
jgi:hypothetical protein